MTGERRERPSAEQSRGEEGQAAGARNLMEDDEPRVLGGLVGRYLCRGRGG